MKLYLITQKENTGYDTYDSAVVCAPDELTARNIDPCNGEIMTPQNWKPQYGAWASAVEQVQAEYLGEAKMGSKQGIVLASYNAG